MPALCIKERLPLMWFKNLLTYRLTQEVPFEPEALEAALASKPARPAPARS